MQFFLRAPFFAFKIREEVGVGNVGFVGRVVETLVEDALQFVDEGTLPAHQPGKAEDVVGDVEGIIPGIAFVEAGAWFKVLAFHRIEGGIELTVGQDRAEGAELLAVIMLITQRTVVEEAGVGLITTGNSTQAVGCCFILFGYCLLDLCFGFPTESLGYTAEGIVGNVVFQGMGHGVIVLPPQGDVAQREIIVVIGTEQVLGAGQGGPLRMAS